MATIAARQVIPPKSNTIEKPMDSAIITVRMEPSTEAHPFTAQVHGINSGQRSFVKEIPRGKGIPMMKAIGIIVAVIGKPDNENLTVG